MTDKEKLQRLFDAALKDPTLPSANAPKPAFPTSPLEMPAQAVLQPQTAPSPFPVHSVMPAAPAPQAALPQVFDTVQVPATTVCEMPTMSAVLDDAASEELAALLDEQHKRKTRKRRVEALVTAAVLVGISGGGTLWFVQNPDRIAAFKDVMKDFRSVGDVKSLVAKYQQALDRIAARGKQIDQATAAIGGIATEKDNEDIFMDKEMTEFMNTGAGKEGLSPKAKTVGQRNKALQQSFGHMAEQNGGTLKSSVALKEEESFQWDK
jgi:hypothetical protein